MMVTKWEIPKKIASFDDVTRMLYQQNKIFKYPRIAYNAVNYPCNISLGVTTNEYISKHGLCVRIINASNWTPAIPFETVAPFIVNCGFQFQYQQTNIKEDKRNESAFEEGKVYFEKNRVFLTNKFNGKYIAIWDNDVIDQDTSFSNLAKRVYKKLGYISIYMPFVTPKRRIMRFDSPRYRRSKTGVSRY